jgi:DNA invertase Pin-like site-specific DNA recombinase
VKVGVYYRISADSQVGNSSIAGQKVECHRVCAERGWNDVDEFVDERVSGALHEHDWPTFHALMTACRQGTSGPSS